MANAIVRRFRDSHPEASGEFAEFERYVRQAVNDLHAISDWLNPVAGGGDLIAALNSLAAAVKPFVPCTFVHSTFGQKPLDSIRAERLVQIAREAVFSMLSRNDITKIGLILSDAGGPLQLTIDLKGPELDETAETNFAPDWKILRYQASLIGASLTISSEGGTIVHVAFTNRTDPKT